MTDTSEPQTEELRYDGWAPCVHSDEEEAEVNKNYLNHGLDIETLAWRLNMIGLSPKLMADQWWLISCKGNIWKNPHDMKTAVPIHLSYQGDSLMLALTATYYKAVEIYEELRGEPPNEW